MVESVFSHVSWHHSGETTSASALYMSMSLDGFITGPDDNLDQPLGRDGERLHRWLASGESVGEFRPSDPSAEVFDELMDTGAVVVGRRTFDLVRRWTGSTTAFPSSCRPMKLPTTTPS